MNVVQRIVDSVGGQSELARLLDIRQQSVQEWVTRRRVPAERVLEVERVSGIPRYEIRPDLYPPNDIAPAVSSSRN